MVAKAVIFRAVLLGKEAAVQEHAKLYKQPDAYELVDRVTGQVAGRMKDLCGYSYVYIRPQPGFSRRMKVVQELIELGYLGHDSYRGAMMLRLGSPYQEYSVNEAAANAAAKYLNEQGVQNYVESRLD